MLISTPGLLTLTTPWLPTRRNAARSARYGQLLRMLVEHGRAVLFVGPTGTGKTTYIRQARRGAFARLRAGLQAGSDCVGVAMYLGWLIRQTEEQ